MRNGGRATEAYHHAKIGKYGIDFVLATPVWHFSQIYCFYVYISPTETLCNLINCLLLLCYRLLDVSAQLIKRLDYEAV